jgi:hypothetical protein
MNELKFEILVTGKNGCWGKDKTIFQAKRNCKKSGGKPFYVAYIIPAESEIDGMSVIYPENAAFRITKLGVI